MLGCFIACSFEWFWERGVLSRVGWLEWDYIFMYEDMRGCEEPHPVDCSMVFWAKKPPIVIDHRVELASRFLVL